MAEALGGSQQEISRIAGGVLTPLDGSYDLGLPPAVMRHLPSWFHSIPWERSGEQELPSVAIDTLYYMARVEGNVCRGYLPIVLASRAVRDNVEYTDFAAGAWGPDENGHSIALYTFLDIYHNRAQSTRVEDLQARHDSLPLRTRISETLLRCAMDLTPTPQLFLAAYAVVGYRNELMTQRGYASLGTRLKSGTSEHPVLNLILRHIIHEESEHAEMYRRLATRMLEGEPDRQRLIRQFIGKWPGVVGEGFGGSKEADQVIIYLFENARGRALVDDVDHLVGQLPGLAGVAPTRKRLELALKNQQAIY